MNKINVLCISLSGHNKSNRHVYELLHNTNLNVSLVVPENLVINGKIVIADYQESVLPVISLKIYFNNPRLHFYIGLKKVINELNIQYIIIDYDPLSLIVFYISYIFPKIKIMPITCENIPFTISNFYKTRGLKGILDSLIRIFFFKLISNRIFCLYTINNKGTLMYKSLGVKNVIQIPFGFNKEIFKINKNARKSIRNKYKIENFTISYFGRLIEEKGIHLLIKALAELKDYKWVLLIDHFKLYDNPYIIELNQLIHNFNLKDRIIFIDPKHDQISEYMNASDLIVVPSISSNIWIEQYGRVAAEAMACGKNVLVSNSGQLPFLVKEYGYIFLENNISSLKNILVEIFSKEEIYTTYSETIQNYAHDNLSTESQKSIIYNSINNKT